MGVVIDLRVAWYGMRHATSEGSYTAEGGAAAALVHLLGSPYNTHSVVSLMRCCRAKVLSE